jgi:hypothetical protein
MTSRKEKNQEIKQFLAVLAAAILSAALLTYFFISNFGPSGRYIAGHAMIDPSIVDQIDMQDKDPYTGQSHRFVFDQFAFSFFDSQTKRERTIPVSLEDYEKFYHLVATEASLEQISADLEVLFIRSKPALLTASVRVANGFDSGRKKNVQSVQFTPEDYFRIQLKGEKEGEWAYFYRPRVFDDSLIIFTGHTQ